MRFVPTRVHGMLDYLVGALLIIAPWFFAPPGAATAVPVTLGFAALAYSLFTDYELGVVRRIPMPVHLNLDLASGLALLASPWLLGFGHIVWLPHFVLGLFEIGAAVTARQTPEAPARRASA